MLSVDFLFFIVLYVFNSAFFFFLSEEIRKTLQKEERNRCDHLLKIRSKSTSEFWVVKRDVTSIISRKMLIHIRIFGVFCVERDFVLLGRKCTLLLKWGARTFLKKIYKYSLTSMPSRCRCQRSSLRACRRHAIASLSRKRVFLFQRECNIIYIKAEISPPA